MKLSGGINFRDFGGYKTIDGRSVKKGHFYRSGSLSSLTSQDREILSRHNIRHIIDYRDPIESKSDSYQLWSGVQYESCPANPNTHSSTSSHYEFFTSAKLEAITHDFMETLYEALPFTNSAYRRLFQIISDLQDGAILHHCAIGKDRTGVGSALILMVLGVPTETIYEDYIVSHQNLENHRQVILSKYKHQMSDLAFDKFQYVMSASNSFLQRMFEAIENKYSNNEHFFETELHLTPEKIKQIREKFLE